MFNLVRSRHNERGSKIRAVGPSPQHVPECDKTASEAKELLRRFNPKLVGFGIIDPRGGGSFASKEAVGSPCHNLGSEGPERRT